MLIECGSTPISNGHLDQVKETHIKLLVLNYDVLYILSFAIAGQCFSSITKNANHHNLW